MIQYSIILYGNRETVNMGLQVGKTITTLIKYIMILFRY